MVSVPRFLQRRRFATGLAASLAGPVGWRGAACAEAETVIVTAGRHWGHLTVANAGLVAVRLQPTVLVEASSGGDWRPLVTEMNLVPACDPDGAVRPLPGYVELGARASITPPPWRGWSCNGQCQRHCRSNNYWGAGPFRFRVIMVPTGRKLFSQPFMMPKVPTQPDDAL